MKFRIHIYFQSIIWILLCSMIFFTVVFAKPTENYNTPNTTVEDIDKQSKCEVTADIHYAYYISLPATLTLEVHPDTADFVCYYKVKAKSLATGLGENNLMVTPTLETIDGVKQPKSIDLIDTNDVNNKASCSIKQNKYIFGDINSADVEKINSTEWASIYGLCSANITKNGSYKGNFEFVYGLINATETTSLLNTLNSKYYLSMKDTSKASKATHEHNYVEGECTKCHDRLSDLTVTAEGYSGIYDGNPHSITVTSVGNTIEYSTDNITFSETSPTFTESGTYTVYYKVSKLPYKTVTGSQQVIINKATPTITAPTAKTLTYTGNAQTLINVGTTNGGTLQYKLDNGGYGTGLPSATNAGTYTVYYKVVEDSNHNAVAEKSISVTINKTTGSVTAPTAKSLTYNGSAQTLINAGSTSTGTIQYKLNSGSYGTGLPSATNAGTYTVYYKVVGDGNHTDVAEKSINVTINKAQALKTAPTAKTGLVYNGSAQALLNAGAVNNGTMYYKVGSGSYGTIIPTGTNAGSYDVYYKVIPSDTTNYAEKAETKITVSIGKASGSVTAPTAKTLTYNGSAQTLINAGSSSTGTIQYKLGSGSYGTGLPSATNAGTYTVYYKVVGDSNHNAVAEKSISVTINKADGNIVAPTSKLLLENGNAQVLVGAGFSSTGTVQYKVGSTGTYSNTLPTGIYTNEYVIYYKSVGDKNHKDTVEQSITSEIKYDTNRALIFSSDNVFTLSASKGWDGTLQYSTNKGQIWNTWDGSQLSGTATQPIYLRGTGNTVITDISYDYDDDGNEVLNNWVMTGSNVECHGNIENLLDYQKVANGAHPEMADYCYYSMFENCTSLTLAPELPATTLADSCYKGMFYGCTSLTTAPELPATRLARSCYSGMFENCTSLTIAPELPAMTLAKYCYSSMFRDCTSLTIVALPATTLAEYCYSYMFEGCTSLTTAPELPATTLVGCGWCYCNMFYRCTSLTTAPTLLATKLAQNCYQGMFQGCKSLTMAPELPATTLVYCCYSGMFDGCKSLQTAPALPATTLAQSCYSRMFAGCTSLTTAPELPATTLAKNCYYCMFWGCTSLKLSTTKTSAYQYAYRIPMTGTGTTASEALTVMFYNTGGTFTGTPEINTTYYVPFETELSRQQAAAESLKYALKFNSDDEFTLKANQGKTWNGTLEYSIDNGYTWTEWDGSELSGTAEQPIYIRGTENTVITGEDDDNTNNWAITGSNVECHGNIENLLDYQTVVNGEHPKMAESCYQWMFQDCISLATAPELPATTLADYCYNRMFYNCSSLTTAPALPATTLANHCYSNMFRGCSSLVTAPELPATELAKYCYEHMFDKCTSLTTAPVLSATTLITYCYNGMFYDCTSLAIAPELPATTLANGCYDGMFYGCASLTQTPALPAITLASYCYRDMFTFCKSLTTVSDLPATVLPQQCYDSMFSYCDSLVTPPKISATKLGYGSCRDMFCGCESLTSMPTLLSIQISAYAYDSMFYNCESLKLSTVKTGDYQYTYRIPASGTGKTFTGALTNMFRGTGGTFTGTPTINTIYYTTKPPVK